MTVRLMAPGSDETRVRDPYGPTTGPNLLRQGEPGTSQYFIYFWKEESLTFLKMYSFP